MIYPSASAEKVLKWKGKPLLPPEVTLPKLTTRDTSYLTFYSGNNARINKKLPKW